MHLLLLNTAGQNLACKYLSCACMAATWQVLCLLPCKRVRAVEHVGTVQPFVCSTYSQALCRTRRVSTVASSTRWCQALWSH